MLQEKAIELLIQRRYIEGRNWFIEQMAGLEVTIDAAGNIIGKEKAKTHL
jgi:hypothetical protein